MASNRLFRAYDSSFSADTVSALPAVKADPACFEAWLAKAEVHFASGQYDEALAAGEQALVLRPKDIHIHTSMSRIWMERGDKTKAEHHGAQARILGWGDQLKEPEGKQPGEL